MKKHQKCDQFGWGCDLLDEFCIACKDKNECFDITVEEKAKKKLGYKPDIPKTKEPQKNVAGLSKPRVTDQNFSFFGSSPINKNKKVSFTVWLDVEWLKKQLGWSFDKDKDGAKT